MINYELAKKLKEAGFPQTVHAGTQIYEGAKLVTIGDADCWSPECECPSAEGVRNDLLADNPGKYTKYGPVAPNLEELIESCVPLGFYYLRWTTRYDGTNHDHWTACTHENDKGFGDTPSEAVANLYLAIHENKSQTKTP